MLLAGVVYFVLRELGRARIQELVVRRNRCHHVYDRAKLIFCYAIADRATTM